MPTLPDLESLERKVWRSIHEDGLLELQCGFLVAGMGLYTLLEQGSDGGAWGDLLGPLFMGLGVLIFILGKRFLTLPRAGLVSLGPKARSRTLKAVAVIVASLILGVVALALNAPDPGRLDPIAPLSVGLFLGANALLVFALLAWFLDHPRLYLVAFLLALAFPLRGWLRAAGLQGHAWILPAAALIILAMGVLQLLRFLRRYPLERA